MMATDEIDPYDVVPDGFCEAYGEDTIPAALTAAERADSTTDPDTRERCPACGSVRYKTKVFAQDIGNRRDTNHKCTNCLTHFDDPAPPLCELDIYTDTDDLLEEGHRKATRLKSTMEYNPTQTFDWLDSTDLEDASDRDPILSQLDDRTLTELAITAYRPWSDSGPSYREVAAVLPYSRQWVGERVRAWRDGEHRDLVADPTAEPDETPATDTEPKPAVAVGDETRRWVAFGAQ